MEEGKKGKKVKEIALSYYSRKDVSQYLVKFSKNRESVARFYEGFGKRPDTLAYLGDVVELVKRGATSFHTSLEHWQDPLEISTEMTKHELDEIRTGWDLLIDIDCKWLEYSKKAARALVDALSFHGVKNVGVKFSGGKGLHLAIPWKAFPKEMHGIETRKMFPDWARLICQYLKEVSRPILEKEMEGEDEKFLAKMEKGIRCERCKNMAQKLERVTARCPLCKREETFIRYEDKNKKDEKERKCPDCRFRLIETNKKVFYRCLNCNIDSAENPEEFIEKASIDIFAVLGIDIVLVSSRHLFRMPYSLHEKTALASIVINREEIEKFEIMDANPLKVKIMEFIPDCEEGEARELLIQALDWSKKTNVKGEKEKNKDYDEVIIKDLSPSMYPPCINKILDGMKQDGRKRALFVLMNFFKSLSMSDEEIKEKVFDWNKKNYHPLKDGYIASQLSWQSKQKKMLPPNCDKYYPELGLCEKDNLCLKIKNPVNYTVRKSFATKRKEKINWKSKEKGE